MSIRMFMMKIATAVTMIEASTTVKSRCRMELIISLPTPGNPKIVSTTTAPFSIPAAWSPITVMTGSMALRSACTKMTALLHALGAGRLHVGRRAP